MRIRKVKFEWNQKFSALQVEEVKNAVIEAFNMRTVEFAEVEEGVWTLALGAFDPWIVDTDKLRGVEYTVQAEFGPPTQIQDLESRIETTVNQRVNVAVPGIGLLSMRHVKIAENYCTEELQRELDEGWKILAICPQPDQRRPDYVLGKAESMGVGNET